MKIKGVEKETLYKIAEELNFRIDNYREDGRYHCFVLRMAVNVPTSKKIVENRTGDEPWAKYRKRGFQALQRGSSRWGGNGAVCFHGYKAYMDRVFEVNPDAVIRTTMATYKSRDDYEAKWIKTGMSSMGSMMYPAQYREMCDCV